MRYTPTEPPQMSERPKDWPQKECPLCVGDCEDERGGECPMCEDSGLVDMDAYEAERYASEAPEMDREDSQED